MKITVKGRMATKLVIALSLVSLVAASPQDSGSDQTRTVSLALPEGTPLRLYLTKRVSKRPGAAVEAKLHPAPFLDGFRFHFNNSPSGSRLLMRWTDRIVVDETGMTDLYDFSRMI